MGRPKNEAVAYDAEAVKEYVLKWFTIEQEIKSLREEKSGLKDEYKGKVDLKLVSNVVRLVKAQLKLEASDSTVDDLSELVKEKIGMIL